MDDESNAEKLESFGNLNELNAGCNVDLSSMEITPNECSMQNANDPLNIDSSNEVRFLFKI